MTHTEADEINPKVSLHQVRDMDAGAPLTDQERDELGIIYPGMKNRDLLNTYRDLRNKFLRMSDYNNFVCLVTSLDDDGDSALLALNLAGVFAFDRSRSAIVIDCDEKVSILDELSDKIDDVGLIDFIESDMSDISMLLHDSGIERLRIVPSGRSTETRTESLESLRMRDIVLELKNRYPDRYIFINAPSMKFSSEVQILANVSDMVMFKLEAGKVGSKDISDAIEMIGVDKVAGVIFQET